MENLQKQQSAHVLNQFIPAILRNPKIKVRKYGDISNSSRRVNKTLIESLLDQANYIPIHCVPFTQFFHDFFPKVIGLAASWLLLLLCFGSCHFDIFYAFFRRERLIECEKSGTLTGCQNPLQCKPTCQLTCFRFISKKVSCTQTSITSLRSS